MTTYFMNAGVASVCIALAAEIHCHLLYSLQKDKIAEQDCQKVMLVCRVNVVKREPQCILQCCFS